MPNLGTLAFRDTSTSLQPRYLASINWKSRPPGQTGDRGLACYDDELQRYRIVTMRQSSPVHRFKLTEDLETGGSAEAVLRIWNGEEYIDGDEITVWDWWGISQNGRGMWQATSNAEGWAIRREVNANPEGAPEYDIVWMEQFAKAVEFTLTTGFVSGEASATVTASWAVVDVTLHAIEVPVEFRYHEDSCQVQVRKQQIAIERCTPVGDWQTLLQMTEVTYVTGTEQAAAGSGSSATCTVEHTVAKACVFGVAAAQPNITALTLTRVDPVVDVESRPTELVQTLQPVWVICAGTAYEVQIDTIDECPTGSGSGYT
jgi:hypothetical protein